MDKTFHAITWAEVCADKSLRDLPFKVELNGLNQIVLVPTFSRHSLFQGKIIRLLNRLLHRTKWSVHTPEISIPIGPPRLRFVSKCSHLLTPWSK